MGSVEGTRVHFNRYLEIAQARHDEMPDDPRWLLELSYATSALINVGLNLDEPVTAAVLASIDDNIELARQAMQADDGSLDALAHYGNELAFAGDAFMAACALQASFEARRESLSIAEDLLVRSAASAEFENEVALRQRGLSHVLAAMGNPDAALMQQQAALHTFEKQFNRDPSNETLMTDVAASHRAIGRLLMYTGNLDAAARHQRQAFELLSPLVSDQETLTWQLDEYRDLIGQEVTWARLAGNTALALDLLDRNRALLASTEAGQALSTAQRWARIRYRYERWRLTGTDPVEDFPGLLEVDPDDGSELSGCREAEWIARLAVMTGDRPLAQRKSQYLATAGYRDPGYLAFCQIEGLCAPEPGGGDPERAR
jgi:tetratricopeptide (TPR) repeat protein